MSEYVERASGSLIAGPYCRTRPSFVDISCLSPHHMNNLNHILHYIIPINGILHSYCLNIITNQWVNFTIKHLAQLSIRHQGGIINIQITFFFNSPYYDLIWNIRSNFALLPSITPSGTGLLYMLCIFYHKSLVLT